LNKETLVLQGNQKCYFQQLLMGESKNILSTFKCIDIKTYLAFTVLYRSFLTQKGSKWYWIKKQIEPFHIHISILVSS